MKKKPVIIILALILIVLIFVFFINGIRNRNLNKNIVLVTGTFDLDEIDLSFQVPGNIVTFFVDEGSLVQKGKLLARLDNSEYLKNKEKAQEALNSSKFQLGQINAQIELTRRQNISNISKSESALLQAEDNLSKYKNGFRSQELQQAYYQAESAKSNLKLKEKDFERASRLYEQGAISEQTYDRAKTDYETVKDLYNQAYEQYSLVKEGYRAEDINIAEDQVGQSVASVDGAVANLLSEDVLIEQSKSMLAQIAQYKKAFEIACLKLQQTKLYAPQSGNILVKARVPGENVVTGATVFTLGDLKNIWLRAYINETDLGKIKIGQEVDITTDSYSDKIYKGRIIYIASQAEFTPKNLQTKEDRVKLVYKIKVKVDNEALELKPGMIADAKIDVGK